MFGSVGAGIITKAGSRVIYKSRACGTTEQQINPYVFQRELAKNIKKVLSGWRPMIVPSSMSKIEITTGVKL
jgi:hypothetical protein